MADWDGTTKSAEKTTEIASGFTAGGWGSEESWENSAINASGKAYNSLETLFSPITTPASDAEAIADNFLDVSTSAANAFSEIFEDEEGWAKEGDKALEVVDAAGSFALDYLNEKLERIKDMWNATQQVSIRSLIDDIAPFAAPIKETYPDTGFLELISGKVAVMLGNIMGVSTDESWSSLGKAVGEDILDDLLADEKLLGSVSELKTVQTIMTYVKVALDMWGIFQDIMAIVEPLFPTIQIITNLVSAWITGGASAAEATAQLENQLKVLGIKLLKETIKIFREFIYDLELSLPALLVGALEDLSFKEEFGDEYNSAALGKFLDNQIASGLDKGVTDPGKDYLFDTTDAKWINDYKKFGAGSQKWLKKVSKALAKDPTGIYKSALKKAGYTPQQAAQLAGYTVGANGHLAEVRGAFDNIYSQDEIEAAAKFREDIKNDLAKEAMENIKTKAAVNVPNIPPGSFKKVHKMTDMPHIADPVAFGEEEAASSYSSTAPSFSPDEEDIVQISGLAVKEAAS